VVYAGFCVFGMAFQFVPPLIPTFLRELQLSHGQAGLLMSFFALPGIILSIPGGYLVDRFGVRSIGSSGLGLMAVGTAGMALPVGFHWLLLFRAVAGLGAMVSVVAMQRTVTLLFTGRPLGLPMGIVNTAVPLGIVLALNGALPLAEWCSWRHVALVVSILAGLCCLGYLVMCSCLLMSAGARRGAIQPGDTTEGSGPPAASRMEVGSPTTTTRSGNASFRVIWLAGVVWFCANGAVTSFVTFAPDHYLDLGLGAKSIGIFSSLPMWCAALLGPLIGWLTDRHGGKGGIIASGMWVMAIFLIWVPTGIYSPLVLGLGLGLGLCCLPTPLLSLPGDILSPSHHGRAFGILSACANAGIFLVPPIAGTLRDATGAYRWPFLLMAIVAAVGMVIAFRLPIGRLPRVWAWLFFLLLPLALLVLIDY